MGKKSASKKRDKSLEKGLIELHYDKKKKKDENKTITGPSSQGKSKTGAALDNGTDSPSESGKGSQSSSGSEHSKKVNDSPKSKSKKERKSKKNEEEKDPDDTSVANDSIVTIHSSNNSVEELDEEENKIAAKPSRWGKKLNLNNNSFSPPLDDIDDMFSYEPYQNKNEEQRLKLLGAYTDLPIAAIKDISEFGFDKNSWYFHCFLLAELLSPEFITLKRAWDRSLQYCKMLEVHPGLRCLEHFHTSSNPTSILQVETFVPKLRVYLALTWGVVENYKLAAKSGGRAIALRTAMEKFVAPLTIEDYVKKMLSEVGTKSFSSILAFNTPPSSARAVHFSEHNTSSDNATYIKKGFDSISVHLTAATPTWTEVKQAFVDKLASNFLWYGISKQVNADNSTGVLAEKDSLVMKINLDKYTYMLHNFKTDVYAELSKHRPQVTKAQAMGMDIVEFYLEWKKAFTGDDDTMMRLSVGMGLINRIDLNVGVGDGTKKFYELQEKYLNDWNAAPHLAGTRPYWWELYSFIYKPVTLTGLIPVFQSFKASLQGVTDQNDLELLHKTFVAKLAAEASTYDSQLQNVYSESDARRQVTTNTPKEVRRYKTTAQLPQWDEYLESTAKHPVPPDVWKHMESALKNKFLKGRNRKMKRKKKDEESGADRKLTKEEVNDLIAAAIARNNENNGSGGPPAVPSIPNL